MAKIKVNPQSRWKLEERQPIEAFVNSKRGLYAAGQANRKPSPEEKERITRKVVALLRGLSTRLESERVAGANILIDLLPESLSAIQRLLRTTSSRWSYELHFSLFCSLDQEKCRASGVSDAVYGAVSEYLMTARVTTASAAWMAGDLLGDHWAGADVLDDLLVIAFEARYVAGRLGALHGIEHQYGNVDENGKAKIMKAWEEIARNDRSEKVRSCASLAIKGWRCGGG